MVDQLPKQNRQVVQGRAFGRCERCLQANLCGDLHHRRPKGLGGSKAPDRHDVANLVYVCRFCHSWAHGNPKDAAAAGFLVPDGTRSKCRSRTSPAKPGSSITKAST
jgi:hypothetical protein